MLGHDTKWEWKSAQDKAFENSKKILTSSNLLTHFDLSKNYSQLEKEGLSCIFGIKRFYSYLFGHSFELNTDHKPLFGLLGEHKPTSPQASARIRRWSLYLSMFEYTLKFRKTTEHANADILSQLPTPVELATTDTPPELVLLINHLADSPVTASQIASWTSKDSPDVQFLHQGWPTPGYSQELRIDCFP